jgi:tRNA-specific 2-thiouridylase
MRVLAAMSGGVDSAVAAARARDAGHEVVGVHLALSTRPASFRSGARGCCTLEDARDARRAADVLGIPFYVWDLAERFEADVVADFVESYAAGRTPNPCVRCNQRIKFAALADRALALGFDAVCTGHYARLEQGPHGPVLHRAVDEAKDQSYVLAGCTPAQLAAALFPLGTSRKAQVRAEAARRGLAVADKPDSHDICFVPNGDTAGWLRERLGAAPGPVVDTEGRVVGQHEGAYTFTVGQRRGLRLGTPAVDGRPRYVLGVEPVTRTVRVGPAEALEVTGVQATDPVLAPGVDWADGGWAPVTAQLRAHGGQAPARARLLAPVAGGPASLQVELAAPVRGVAAGQLVVLYDGSRVVGAGTIAATCGPPRSGAPAPAAPAGAGQ